MRSIRSAFVLAAVSSGSGKTTVCNGLLRSLTRHGVKCAPFKTGPDYIDSFFHKKSCGRDSVNLDLFMSGKEHVAKLFDENFSVAEVGVVEGVMGLFDGYDCKKGSAADVASMLRLPVILVIDARSSAYSLAAVISGMRTFESSVNVKEVIFNNVTSENHLSLLKRAAQDGGVEYVGHIMSRRDLATPSRYLGLAMDNPADIEKYIANAANAVEEGVDLDRLLRLTECGGGKTMSISTNVDDFPFFDSFLRGKRIAVAHDEAFNFIYPENIKSFRRLCGDEGSVVEFSPLEDASLPNADLIYFPGGYPEIYAERLSKNRGMMDSVRKFAEGGGMIYGECGGFLYLSKSIDGIGMCGILPFKATMASPRLTLGYRRVMLPGMEIRGHEFHYSSVVNPEALPSISSQTDVRGKRMPVGMYRVRNTVAGYTHLYWGEQQTANRLMTTLFGK